MNEKYIFSIDEIRLAQKIERSGLAYPMEKAVVQDSLRRYYNDPEFDICSNCGNNPKTANAMRNFIRYVEEQIQRPVRRWRERMPTLNPAFIEQPVQEPHVKVTRGELQRTSFKTIKQLCEEATGETFQLQGLKKKEIVENAFRILNQI